MTYEIREQCAEPRTQCELIIGETEWGERGMIFAWPDKNGHVSQRTSVTPIDVLPQMLSLALRASELPLSVLTDIATDVVNAAASQP